MVRAPRVRRRWRSSAQRSSARVVKEAREAAAAPAVGAARVGRAAAVTAAPTQRDTPHFFEGDWMARTAQTVDVDRTVSPARLVRRACCDSSGGKLRRWNNHSVELIAPSVTHDSQLPEPITSRPVAWAKCSDAIRRSICASTTPNREDVRSVSASSSSTLLARPFWKSSRRTR